MMLASNQDLKNLTNELLNQAGIFSRLISITPIRRDGNNQIYCIQCADQKYILKKYFQHPKDKYDRLSNEFTFLSSIYKPSLYQIPKPYTKIEKYSVALYEYIDGEKLSNSAQVTESFVIQAGHFVAELNKIHKPLLEKLIKPAKEACFSIQQHIELIDTRIEELKQARPIHSSNLEFNLVLDEIIDNWIQIKYNVIKRALNEALNLEQVLQLNHRILSPSDFGFHNAIIRSNQQIAFIDFEYAGWDDPAKLAGDFFSQVAIKIDPKYFNLFMQSAFGNLSNFDTIFKKTSILLSAFKIKWCCIVLNIFLPVHLARRKFVNSSLNILKLEKQQLVKARQLLKEISL